MRRAEARLGKPRLRGAGAATAAQSTQGLLAACRRGDADAWDAIVKRHERLVFSVALRNGLGADDAAEVTQITFVALLDAIDTLQEDERLAWWLMTVARRQAWRVRERLDRERCSPWADDEGTQDTIGDWEEVAALHDAIAQLDAPNRQLVESLYFEAATPSYAEIAEQLGRAVGGIGPMRSRCLDRLRELLGDPVA